MSTCSCMCIYIGMCVYACVGIYIFIYVYVRWSVGGMWKETNTIFKSYVSMIVSV